MAYWLMKSEPSEMSIDDLAKLPKQTAPWTGVRNYQARNFMRDQMKAGDQAFFYHSSCEVPGIYGTVEIMGPAFPDPTQFDKKDPYFDAKSSPENPRWSSVDVRFLSKCRAVSISDLRGHAELAEMRVLQKGNRLSITPVSKEEWRFIAKLMKSA
jgi:predicted RNA-binding protein with PUA-like domain